MDLLVFLAYLCFDFRQVTFLLIVGNRHSSHPISFFPFSKSGIIQFSTTRKCPEKYFLLLLCRIQPVLECLFHRSFCPSTYRFRVSSVIPLDTFNYSLLILYTTMPVSSRGGRKNGLIVSRRVIISLLSLTCGNAFFQSRGSDKNGFCQHRREFVYQPPRRSPLACAGNVIKKSESVKHHSISSARYRSAWGRMQTIGFTHQDLSEAASSSR